MSRVTGSRPATFLAVLVPLLFVYASTASWSLPYHKDAATNAITGWYLAEEGTVITRHHAHLTDLGWRNRPWLFQSPAGPVSQYPPGAGLWAGLFYLLPSQELQPILELISNDSDVPPVPVPMPPLWPATLSAVVATSAAAAVLALVFLEMGYGRTAAVTGGITFGLATTAWTVASAMSWSHGPAMLAIAVGLLASAQGRWALGGAAFGFGILTRPHIALVPALIGLGVSRRRRGLRPLLALGITSALGLIALLLYNLAIWRTLTLSGGYGDRLTETFAESDLAFFLANLAGALFDIERGLLIWAPFVAILALGAIRARATMPDWAAWSALGGIAYLLVQLSVNRFSGGDAFFGYRYPLEALTAASPALFVGYIETVKGTKWQMRFLVAGLCVGVVGQVGYLLTRLA